MDKYYSGYPVCNAIRKAVRQVTCLVDLGKYYPVPLKYNFSYFMSFWTNIIYELLEIKLDHLIINSFFLGIYAFIFLHMSLHCIGIYNTYIQT